MSILAPFDENSLLLSGLASPTSSDGTRRIHKRRLNRTSDEENTHIPLLPVWNPSSPDTADDSHFHTIPAELISEATLRYLGYNDDIATLKWNQWSNWEGKDVFPREVDDDVPFGLIMTFIDFATGHIMNRQDATSEDDEQAWRDCMDDCEITEELQDAIMDPLFKLIRSTESCLFWIMDTFKMRYRTLEDIQRTSREREMAIQRAHSRPSTSASADFGSLATTSDSSSLLVDSERRSISGTQRLIPGIERNTALSAAALVAQNAPCFTVLYKGVDQARIDGLFDSAGTISRFEKLISGAPSDFLTQTGFYFTVDRDIALYYAAYAKRRDNVTSVVLIQMSIPSSAIETLSETQLLRVSWPSPEWKRLIFHCRRSMKLPSELRKFKLATLIIGTISKKPSKVYQRLESPEEITEAMVLKGKYGQNGIQYVWPQDEGQDFLEEHGRLQVFPLTSQEYRTWYDEINSEE